MSTPNVVTEWVERIADEVVSLFDSQAAWDGHNLDAAHINAHRDLVHATAKAAGFETVTRLAKAGLLSPDELVALATRERGDRT